MNRNILLAASFCWHWFRATGPAPVRDGTTCPICIIPMHMNPIHPIPISSDNLTMRTPVEGTVPREMVPFPWEKTDEDRIAAGKALVNPLEAKPENLARGKAAYGIFCISCHGPAGRWTGISVIPVSAIPIHLPTWSDDKVRALKDGEIYHSITVGYGIMGAHGGMIRPEDRWKIILHIRENLQK